MSGGLLQRINISSQLWDRLTSSYWFLPMLMALGAIAVGIAMIILDETVQDELLQLGLIYTGNPVSAISLLTAIAGSMVSVASMTFSITMVALTMASSQFGPRILGNFMRDRSNQLVLGLFIATFIYCLIVLQAVRDEDPFVPQLSISLALIMAVISLFFLIYFLHHMALSLMADNIVASIAKDITSSMDTLYPEELGQGPKKLVEENEPIPEDYEARSAPVQSSASGYVQALDEDGLMDIAKDEDLIIHLDRRPGYFVIQNDCLARVLPRAAISDKLVKRVNACFTLGGQRTPRQDLAFSISELVEIAIRALSPSLNDTFTAVRCVDQLGAALSLMAQREIPSPLRHDGNGRLRVIAWPLTFDEAVDSAFTLIRLNANIPVLIRLLDTIRTLAALASRRDYMPVLFEHARMVHWAVGQLSMAPREKEALKQRYDAAIRTLEERGRMNVSTAYQPIDSLALRRKLGG
ncbi:MAG: DUF2254 domain-containing protein [Desulfocurvibacter africanus]